jgi:hypothetical protein
MNIPLIVSLSETGNLAMRKITWLKNLAVNAVAIIGLELAGHAPVNAAEAIGQHGYWTAVSDTGTGEGGDTVCGVRTQMTNGAELRLVRVGQEVHLIAYDPTWTMPADGETRVAITIDGEVYRGRAEAADANTLVVRNLTPDFLEEFMNGMKMEADFGGAHWTVSLIGSSRATSAMGDCMPTAQRGFIS